jgi:hypothetical protein
MLGAHPAIFAPPETHLLTPLAHLGFYANVEKAPYDPIITRQAAHELVRALPGGEADYLAVRACSVPGVSGVGPRSAAREDARLRAGARLPREALPRCEVPGADAPPARGVVVVRGVVLRRRPRRRAHEQSVARTLRPGDRALPARAARAAAARPLRDAGEGTRRRDAPRLRFLGIDFVRAWSTTAANGEAPEGRRRLGDPITVGKDAPTDEVVAKWATEMADDPTKLAQARQILDHLLDEDLETWGYPRAGIAAQLDAVTPSGAKKSRSWNRYALERRLLVRLRKNIHHNAFGRLVQRIRFVCDVLLR